MTEKRFEVFKTAEKRFIIDEEKIKNNHINYIQVLQNLLSNEGLE